MLIVIIPPYKCLSFHSLVSFSHFEESEVSLPSLCIGGGQATDGKRDFVEVTWNRGWTWGL